MKLICFPLLAFLLLSKSYAQPTISFTFDDGITGDMPGYQFEEWNAMILGHLEKADLKSIFFVTGFNKHDNKGKYLLESWDAKGHRIANHTYSHLNYGSKLTSFETYQREFVMVDTIIRRYKNFIPLFRFPYLKEGDTRGKVDSFRALLTNNGYKNGAVTVDASDWYIDSRLIKRLRENLSADINTFKEFYLAHIFERAKYYEAISYNLNRRHIKHTLLLHHNLTSALFLGDLIKMFKEKGWEVIDAEEAYHDDIFNSKPSTLPAGESLIWSLAKETGRFEGELRYPAEDSRYEIEKMDKLGL
jgi:peptidoglycan/xylan/chitin deacetylase (PgdA/CDA1 family)